MRTLVIGDIHGGLKALHQVLELAQVTNEDKLIFLGDYVDGWSDVPYLLDFLQDLSKTNDCVFIKGNHDVYLNDYLSRGNANRGWLIYGGALTLMAYKMIGRDPQEHINFLEQAQFSYIDADNNLFVHGGFREQDVTSMGLIDSVALAWDRELCKMH